MDWSRRDTWRDEGRKATSLSVPAVKLRPDELMLHR
jgi:hypothetical protein